MTVHFIFCEVIFLPEKNKKSDILKAAYELFIKNGYDNTSIKMIANKAGVVQSHIYAFFKNKETLFDETLRMAQDNYQSKMYAAMQQYAHLPPEEFVERCIDVIFGFRDEAGFTMASALTPKLRARAEPILKEYSSGMTVMMKPLFPDLPDELLYDIGSLLLAVSDSFIVDGDRERGKRTGVFAITLFLRYLDDLAKQHDQRKGHYHGG